MKRILLHSDISKQFRVEVIKPDGHVTMWKRCQTKSESTEFLYKLRTQARYWDYRQDRCRVAVTDLSTNEVVKEIELSM